MSKNWNEQDGNSSRRSNKGISTERKCWECGDPNHLKEKCRKYKRRIEDIEEDDFNKRRCERNEERRKEQRIYDNYDKHEERRPKDDFRYSY